MIIKNNFYILLISLIIIVSATFYKAIFFDFLNFDDDLYVYNNAKVLSGLNFSSIRWAFFTSHGGHWHPLSWIAHMFDISLFGNNPKAMHLVNIVFHLINVNLLFLIVYKLSKIRILAFYVSLIFAIHPLRLESVVWISQRKDLLSMFFLLSSILTYISFVKNKNPYKYLLICFLFIFGLLAKPTIITLPIILLFLDLWPLKLFDINNKSKIVKSLIEKTPLLLISLSFSLTTILAQNSEGALKNLNDYSLYLRVQNTIVSYVTYFSKFFYVNDVVIFYPFKEPTTLSVILGIIILLSLTIIFSSFYKNYRYLLVSWLLFLITLFPMSGIIQVGGQAYANRWTYLPHIFLAIGFVTFIYKNFKSKFIFNFICIFFCGFLAFKTSKFIAHWKNSKTLFSYVLQVTPNNFMAHVNLGEFLDRKGELGKAEYHFKKALETNPNYPLAINNLGSVIARLKSPEESEIYFKEALKIKPNYVPALYNLGLVYSYKSLPYKSLYYWIMSLSIDASYKKSLNSLSYLFKKGIDFSCKDFNTKLNSFEKNELSNFFIKFDLELLSQDLNYNISKLKKCF